MLFEGRELEGRNGSVMTKQPKTVLSNMQLSLSFSQGGRPVRRRGKREASRIADRGCSKQKAARGSKPNLECIPSPLVLWRTA